MKLSRHSDYALRTLVYLALHRDALVTTGEIAEAYGISRHHLQKVVGTLGRAGVLDVRRGVGGGMSLAREPAQITLGAVLRATEQGAPLVECFDAERNGCVIAPACSMKDALGGALEAFFAHLDGTSLADVVAGGRRRSLRALLQSPSAPAD